MTPMLPSRTADYVASLMREGDNFDYCKWLQQVREEEAQTKQHPPPTITEQIVREEIDVPVSTARRHRQMGDCLADARPFQ
jgi:hypothetical protein